ncbi:hypothetical protein EDD15DRAFT_2191566 [Pisolithus albus]|nr:hypothetical protein EDD15DRAFT_2191566 [Pisolithus albus]
MLGHPLPKADNERLTQYRAMGSNELQGLLPLIPGMPVMIMENLAIGSKIINSARGTLRDVIYSVKDDQKIAQCAYVLLPSSTLQLPLEDEHVVPTFLQTSYFSYKALPGRSFKIARHQLPIIPAWAFTDYKVQGASLDKVIVDLARIWLFFTHLLRIDRSVDYRKICAPNFKDYPTSIKRHHNGFTASMSKLPNLWPLPHSEKITAHTGPNHLQHWERYPCQLEEMGKWAVVAKDKSTTDRSRENIIVYRNPPDCTSNALFPVSVHLYGCLQKFTVGKFGNWDGNPLTAKQAIQSLTLTSGGHREGWQNQLDALNVASAFASRTLQIPLHQAHFPRQLYFQRKVFQQADDTSSCSSDDHHAHPISDSHPPTQISPLGTFLTNPNWQWNDALPVLQLTANRECIPLHEIRLNKFDFIEVDAEFNVVVSRGKEGTSVLNIFLSFKHMVRLLDATSTKVTNTSQKHALDSADYMESTPHVKRLCAVTRPRAAQLSTSKPTEMS